VDWELRYQKGDIPWEKGEPAPPLVEFLQQYELTGKVLVPGCGYGHDVRLLALAGVDVTGIDVAPSALAQARRYPPAGNESYIEANFLNLPEVFHGQFDYVVEHTCFCAVEPAQWERYRESAAAALKPGGRLAGIFFTLIEDADPEQPPYAINADELETLFDPRFEIERHWVPRLVFPARRNDREEMWLMRKRSAAGA